MKPEIPLPFDDPAVVILALRVALQKMEAATPAEQAAMLAQAAERRGVRPVVDEISAGLSGRSYAPP